MSVVAVLDEKVLVLNRMYAAVRVVSARRAFTMLCKQAAEVIAFDDGRYINYDFETWREIAEFQRQFEREQHDNNRCQYCGKHFATKELTLDHVIPRVQGGEHTWDNLVCACVKCNARKGGRTPHQAHMHLIRRPVRPKRNPSIMLRLGSAKYHSWTAFLDEAYWTVELKD